MRAECNGAATARIEKWGTNMMLVFILLLLAITRRENFLDNGATDVTRLSVLTTCPLEDLLQVK